MDEFVALLGTPATRDIAIATLLSFVIFSIIRGWLIPRAVLIDRIADKNSQIENLAIERTNLTEANKTKDGVIHTQAQQISTLIEGLETTNHLLDVLRNQILIDNSRGQLRGQIDV